MDMLKSKLIYIADEDQDHNQKLTLQLKPHGFEVQSFQHLNRLHEAVLAQPPAAIICNTSFSAGPLAGIQIIQQLQKHMQNLIPILFISEQDDAEIRVQALRVGGQGYFIKPLRFPSLVAKLYELTNKEDNSPYRVLMVDDDPSGNMLHSAMLKKSGCQVVSITKPLQAISAALKLRPDIIFLDLYMPEVDGLELAILLRQEESLLETPIVFLSGEEDEEIKLKAIREGAASFLTKPVSANHLVGVAQTRAYQYRARQVRQYYSTKINPVTGFIVRDVFFQRLGELYRKYQNKDRVLAMIMIAIDDYGLLFRSLGEDHIRLLRAHMAYLIRGLIKDRDLACSYTENRFLIAASRSSISRLKYLVNQIFNTLSKNINQNELFKRYKITVSIGVSKINSEDYNQVVSEVALSCDLAQAEGGNQIQYHADLEQEDMDEQKAKHLAIQIKDAITNKRLILAYSPILSSSIEADEKYTVMMRLKTKEGKVIYPAEFIVVAHKYKVMPVLDRYMIATAVQALSLKQKQGQKLSYFVKLSLSSLKEPEFLSWLERILTAYSLQEDSLVFEISEADLAVNLDLVRTLQTHLQKFKQAICIDRFGRTKESIKLLDLIQTPYIRLDPSLVQDIAQDRDKQKHLREFCAALHEKEVVILSGYIQDISSLALLWSLGVDYIQGDILDETTEMKMI